MTTRGEATERAEEPWVRALQRREAWAWERLHQQTLERVFAYVHWHCRRRGRRPELLEVDLPPGAADTAVMAGWGESPAAESPAAALERRETAAEVRRLVLALPEAQREALLLRCVEELSLAEIARVLGRSENAVKGLLHRAKATVQAQARAEASTEPIDSGDSAAGRCHGLNPVSTPEKPR